MSLVISAGAGRWSPLVLVAIRYPFRNQRV